MKRPELEQEVPRRATTEPTDPVQADWTQVSSVTGADAPFQGAVRVPLLGPVDEDWLAALEVVQAVTDVLTTEVEDAALFVPDPWRDEPALTQAGKARHALREAVIQFLNVVNDEHANRTTPDHAKDNRKAFDALVKGAIQHVQAWVPGLGGPNEICTLIYAWQPGVGVSHGVGFTHGAAVGVYRPDEFGRLKLSPPDSVEERDAAIDKLVQLAAADVAKRGKPRAALIFTSWVEDQPWAVVHVCDRERAVTRQTPLVVRISDNNVATLKTSWETVDDPHRRFRALQEALRDDGLTTSDKAMGGDES